MAKDGPSWDGLLKWSIAHSDGTAPNRAISEEDRRWFMEAMQSQTVDIVKRMKEITFVMQTPDQVLEEQGVTATDIEDMLEELQEHVESIDMANDLHSIGGLAPLLSYLKNSHANIRAKAADVVTTIVQNNPKSQQLVMDANGLEALLSNFTSDPDVTARTKALGAISSLIRNNKSGVAAFRLGNGYAGLRDALSSDNVRFQRKALNLLQYLLQENYSDHDVATDLGFPRIMTHFASSSDTEVREAALRALLELTKDKTSGTQNALPKPEEEKLNQILRERIDSISALSPEDLEATKEERHLVDSLWSVCNGSPSSLRERGLLVLEGEDELPPDVVSQHFEPPLRAFSAREAVEARAEQEKKDQPPLLLGGPPRGSSSENR